MSPKMRRRKPSADSPLIESPLNIKYENIKEKQTIEFIPNTIKEGEATIVRIKKWVGISEPCFAVALVNGKIQVKQIKEEEQKKDG